MINIIYIVQKRLTGLLLLLLVLLQVNNSVYATEVLNIKIDPPSPVYNQPFKCTLTLDQDDHRNACDLLPLDAAPDMKPWDICRIDHISNDALTRFYNCIANADRHVPGPGQYQIVVWNFTGDGETGQVTARQNITILSSPPPSPTKRPSPIPTVYIPAPTSIPSATPSPYQSSPLIPTEAVLHPTQSVVYTFPTQTPTPLPTERPDASLKLFDDMASSLSSSLVMSFVKTKASILAPLWKVISQFLAETHF